MLDNNNLQIAMLELSDQNRAVLDFYFTSAGSNLYTVVDEDKAEAFITDYDVPGAKEQVESLIITHKKPIIILSVREQEIPSTIWLAKPLTADSLTKAADSLKQMIAANADVLSKEVPVESFIATDEIPEIEIAIDQASEIKAETVDTLDIDTVDSGVEEPAIETSNFEINKNNEIPSGSSVSSPSLAGDFDLDDEDENDDNFDLIKSDADEIKDIDDDLNVYKKVEEQLTIAGAASLAAVAVSSVKIADEITEKNSDKLLEETIQPEATVIKESEHLEFTDVLLNNSDQIIDDEQDSDVDALLDSLMSDSEEELLEDIVVVDNSEVTDDNVEVENKFESDTESVISNDLESTVQDKNEDDIFLDSLELDEELKTDKDEHFDFTRDLDDKTEINLEETQLESKSSAKPLSEEANAFDFLDENTSDEKIDEKTEIESIPLVDDSINDVTEVSIPSDSLELESSDADEIDTLDESLPSLQILQEERSVDKTEDVLANIEKSLIANKATENALVDDDLILDSIDTEVISEEPKVEDIETKEIDLEDIALLDESIPLEDQGPLVVEDKDSLLLDENFTLHDDKKAADEDSFAKTLEVDYSDIKADESGKIVNAYDSMESEEFELEAPQKATPLEAIPKTETLVIGAEESLEKDLFNFDLEPEDPTVEKSDASINAIESSEDDVLSLLDESPKVASNNDLDNLLAEVSGVNGSIEENILIEEKVAIKETANEKIDASPENNATVASFAQVVTPKKSNLGELEQTVEAAKDDSEFDLQSLLNEVREEAGNSGDDFEGLDGNGAQNQTKAEKRWMQLCGNNNSISSQKEAAKLTYKLKNHLLGTLLDELDKIKGSEQLYRLKYHDLIIVMDHSQDSIYCNLPVTIEEFSEVCFSEIDTKKIKIHDLDYSEVRLYRNKIKENPDRAHSIESFIWITSLLTSRGRLPEKTDVTKKVGLKVWPNLTRSELSPHSMNIAAVFSKHPGNLLEVSEWLNIEQRFVFAFYNAAFILGMIESDSSKLKKSSFSFGRKNSKIKPEEKGFFGRLLKRLKS